MNLRATMLSTVAVMFLASAVAFAQTDGSNTAPMGYTTQAMPNLDYSHVVQGDYVAAGVGMRNKGYGTITLSLPAGATILKATLYWAIIWDDVLPVGTGMINGNAVTGSVIGNSVSPCWAGDGIRAYKADVTAYTVNGANNLTNFESGMTDGSDPWAYPTFPLLEGASLVVIFKHPQYDFNRIKVYEGCETFWASTQNLAMGPVTAWTSGWPGDETAHTSYIFGDGQVVSSGDAALYNGTTLLGPSPDAFPGNDGYLWDTYNHDVSAFYPNGVPTAATATVTATGDCITWVSQAASFKAGIHVPIDVKAGSCPNPYNVKAGGKLPVAILGTPYFDVRDIDVSTVRCLGYYTIGGEYLMDVAAPYFAVRDDCYDCVTTGADGYLDLNVRFNRKDLSTYLSNLPDGYCYKVVVQGYLNDGTPWVGYDILKIIKKGNPNPKDPVASTQELVLDLALNHPNPVTDFTVISYTLPEAQSMHLAVYNALGQEVATLHSGLQSVGQHQVRWDGINNAGARVSPGVYFYKLHASNQVLAQKLLMTR